MKDISMERVDSVRQEILETVKSPVLTHEQKVSTLAKKADLLLDVLDVPEGFEELADCPIDTKCICDLAEGRAPLRPRYIIPDYKKFLKEGSSFLKIGPAKDLFDALNNLLIFYKHVPSVTNFPVYLGAFDELFEPYLDGYDDETVLRGFRMFLTHIDRTITDSFAHANLGPYKTRAGKLIMEAESTLDNAVPNITLKYDKDTTPDDFALDAVRCSLRCAKPSFANHKMFKSELGEDYVIASCYNGLKYGGGSYTLCRLILGNIAKKASDTADFFNDKLPHVLSVMASYMDARIKFEVCESGFFENNFLSKEGFISRDKFTAMYGLVGLAECVNILLKKEGSSGRFGYSKDANDLGVRIMNAIDKANAEHYNEYCEATGGHFLLHAQVGISDDIDITPGTRFPIGEEPEELIDQLDVLSKFHKYFPSGTGDIFPIDITVHNNPLYVLDIVKGSFEKNLRYMSFYSSESDVVRVTGYLVKRSELEKLDSGLNVLHDTTAMGLGAAKNGNALKRKVR